MTQMEFERALAKILKSIFNDAKYGLEQLRKVEQGWSTQSEDALCFSNAYESMLVILAKLEALRFFADSMADLENEE